jgi:hypothetical protein
MQIEVRTRMKPSTGEVIIDTLLLPRGSGNRKKARELGEAWERHPLLAPHVLKVVCGASRVTVHLRASIDAMAAVVEATREARKQVRDAEGQLRLFGKAVAS